MFPLQCCPYLFIYKLKSLFLYETSHLCFITSLAEYSPHACYYCNITQMTQYLGIYKKKMFVNLSFLSPARVREEKLRDCHIYIDSLQWIQQIGPWHFRKLQNIFDRNMQIDCVEKKKKLVYSHFEKCQQFPFENSSTIN